MLAGGKYVYRRNHLGFGELPNMKFMYALYAIHVADRLIDLLQGNAGGHALEEYE